MKKGPMAAIAGLAILAGCSLAAANKHYSSDGLVLAVNAAARTITISHRDIPGLMPAMVMEFSLGRGERISGIEPGARITFELTTGARYIVRHVKRIPTPPLDHAELAPRMETATLHVGDTIPDFELVDEYGESFRLSRLKGRWIAIDFVYSRCPVPNMCPRLSANFAYLQRRFGDRLDLVSVTLDPRWDRPPVLLEYSKRWGANPARWHFVTGDERTIRRVAEEFGVQYWIEEDALAHGSAVGIIGPDGRLVARVEGTSYPVGQLADLVGAQLGVR